MRKILAAFALLAALAVPAIVAAQAPPPVPALPDAERRTVYALTASTCPACSVGFALYGDGTDYGNWLEVWIITGSGNTAVATKLTAVTDYTLSSVTGPLATIPRPITNATITLTSGRTGTLEIVGARRPRRLSQFAENRGVAARDLNQTVTDLVAENRELWDKMGRALVATPGDTIGPLPVAAVRAGGLLGFNSSGDPIALAPTGGLGNVIGPNLSVVGHIATFGNTTGTLLLDGGLIGAGDVVGPASALDNQMAVFSGTGGKILKATGPIVTASTGTITLTNGKTFAVTNTLTLGGTDGSAVAFGTGGTVAYTGNTLAVFSPTTSAQLAGVISDETGTGALVFANTPTMVTPVLGVATATSINKVAITAPATSATLTIADGKTLTSNNSITLAGTDGKSLVLTNGLTVTTNDGTLAFGGVAKTLTVNNSIGLSGADGKTLTVSNSGTLGGADGWTLAIAASKTLTVSNTLTFTGTDSTSFAFPSTSDTVATLTATQTLSNKTITSPTINGGALTALTSLCKRSTGTGAFDLCIANSENLTAGRSLDIAVNNANRALSLSGNLTIAAGFTTAGSAAITLTATGTTNVTLPLTGTLAAIDTSQTFSGTNIFSALTQFTDIKLSSGKIYPSSDGTSAIQITKADATTAIAVIDTTNRRIGINKSPGAFDIDTNSHVNVGGTLTFGTLSATSLGASVTTITGLTVNNSPNSGNDYFLYFNAADNAIRKCTIGSCASAAAAGVSALNGLTGSLSITQGGGILVSAGGASVTVATNGYVFVGTQSFCASGCTTTIAGGGSGTYTRSSNVTFGIVEVVGGGGGGGGVVAGNGTTTLTAGGGGGGGGYCRKAITSIGTSLTVNIGAAGAGGASSGATGGTGGTSSFDTSGANYRATGGAGGLNQAANTVGSTPGGVGGAGTACDQNIAGSPGVMSNWNASAFVASGTGGAAGLGYGGGGASVQSGTGTSGGLFGGGGAGGGGGLAAAAAGGPGGTGLVLVHEYRN